MRSGVTVISAVAVLLSAIGVGRAQAPLPGPPPVQPAPGFVSTYEIVHTLRAAGFDPLAPPLREGTIYVARATDYRGILMRVVLDARTGAIRDANRIVPGPGNYGGPNYGGPYGPYGEADDPYGGPLYGPGRYDGPGPYGEAPPYGAEAYGRTAPSPYERSPVLGMPTPPPPAHAATGAGVPPLPRPRPPELAARKPAERAKADLRAKENSAKPPAALDPKAAIADDPKPGVTASAPPPAPAPSPASAAPPAAAAQAAPPPSPSASHKAPTTLTINN